jgi:anti-sigma B factor antagonist
MALTYQINDSVDPILISLSGKLSLGPQLTRFSKDAAKAVQTLRPKGVLLELSAIEEVDSSGLGELVILYTACDQVEARLGILTPSDRVARVIAATKLSGILPQFADAASATAWVFS